VVSVQTLLVERESSRYQQLFDQEDNSFFAEKLYNAFDIYKYLKVNAGSICLNCIIECPALNLQVCLNFKGIQYQNIEKRRKKYVQTAWMCRLALL
jgi:hypothetical protein